MRRKKSSTAPVFLGANRLASYPAGCGEAGIESLVCQTMWPALTSATVAHGQEGTVPVLTGQRTHTLLQHRQLHGAHDCPGINGNCRASLRNFFGAEIFGEVILSGSRVQNSLRLSTDCCRHSTGVLATVSNGTLDKFDSSMQKATIIGISRQRHIADA